MSAVVEVAEYAIRHFAGDCDRYTAEQAMRVWAHYEDLSRDTRALVLARFPEPQEPDPVPGRDFYPREDPVGVDGFAVGRAAGSPDLTEAEEERFSWYCPRCQTSPDNCMCADHPDVIAAAKAV